MIDDTASTSPSSTGPLPAASTLPGSPRSGTCIVAVGASAGGLEALERLFAAMPADLGAAFVVIQHLAPDHKSMMAELLSRYTTMPVRLVEDGMLLVENTVYLIPPAKLMTLEGEQLRLAKKPPRTLTLPIDVFFGSLARERRNQSVAMVLSGTGSDGSRGGVEVQRAGGFVMVQDPLSARFDGMPRSAITAGLNRAILAPEALATRLAQHLGAAPVDCPAHGPSDAQAQVDAAQTASEEDGGDTGNARNAAGAVDGNESASGCDAIGDIDMPDATSGPAGDVTDDTETDTDDSDVIAAILDPELMGRLYRLLATAGSTDFQDYKPGTIGRRLTRRMAQRGMVELQDYLALLHADRSELIALSRELLIPVTHFFRDSHAFEALRAHVIEPLVGQRLTGHPVRVWCAGVATGEEAYSIAALLLDAFEAARKWPMLKVFATDVEQDNIDTASKGRYEAAAAAELPPAVRERYFDIDGGALIVRPALRQCVVFARHDLLNDPPFTRMDLVVCRNTLIYFKTDAQRRVLRRLQYALTPRGCLFLGKSESIGELETDFQSLERSEKIWRLVRPAPRVAAGPVHLQAPGATVPRPRPQSSGTGPTATLPVDEADAGMAVLRGAYAPPPAVLMNARNEVVHAFGQVGRYLAMRPGHAGLELTRLLPERLAPYAIALLHKTARDGTPARSDVVRVPYPGEDGQDVERLVRLATWPVARASEARTTLLVFEPVAEPPADAGTPAPPAVDVSAETLQRMEMIESELAVTRETLQSTIEELETSNEELQATNEELTASNEELQSTNEELQSVNEELNTINAEYHEKIEVLDRVNADLDSLTRVAAAGAVFVDDALRITRFSPDAPDVFRLREQDVGRPIGDVAHDLHYPALFEDLRRCVQGSVTVEKDVTASSGRHFLVKMLPCRLPSAARPAGVLSFVESTTVHEATQLQRILDALAEHVAVVDRSGRIRMVNAAWRRFAGENGDTDLQHCGPGTDYLAVCDGAKGSAEDSDAARAAEGLRAVLDGRLERFWMEYPCHSPQRHSWFVMHVRPLHGDQPGAVISHVDITPWVERTPEDV